MAPSPQPYSFDFLFNSKRCSHLGRWFLILSFLVSKKLSDRSLQPSSSASLDSQPSSSSSSSCSDPSAASSSSCSPPTSPTSGICWGQWRILSPWPSGSSTLPAWRRPVRWRLGFSSPSQVWLLFTTFHTDFLN